MNNVDANLDAPNNAILGNEPSSEMLTSQSQKRCCEAGPPYVYAGDYRNRPSTSVLWLDVSGFAALLITLIQPMYA